LVEQARAAGADLLVFPELSLTGYVLQDLATTVAHHPSPDDPIFKHLFRLSKDLDLVVGFVDEDRRHRFFISSAYLSAGKLLHIHHKVYLPTYGLFDEGVSLPGATIFAPSTHVLAGWAFLSVRISGTPHSLSLVVGWSRPVPVHFCLSGTRLEHRATTWIGALGGAYQPPTPACLPLSWRTPTGLATRMTEFLGDQPS